MNCQESQQLLQRRLDGETVPTSPDLEQHLAACLACRQSFSAAHDLLEDLKSWTSPAPPAQFSRRIVTAVLHDRQHRRHRLRVRVGLTVALAASILFMAWAGNLWLPEQKPTPNKHLEVGPLVEHPQLAPENQPLAQKVDEARQAVAALSDRVAEEAKDQARFLIAAAPVEMPLTDLTNMPPLEEPLQPAAQSLRQAGQGVSEGLLTVSQSARRAVAYFVNELPALE